MIYINETMDDPRSPGKLLFDGSRDLPMHWHNNVEICYYLRGGFKAHVDAEEFRIENGNLLIINSGQMHYMGSKTVGKNKGVSIIANMEFWNSMCPDLYSLEFDLAQAPDKVPELKHLMHQLYESALLFSHGREKDPSSSYASSREQMRMTGVICLVYYYLVKYFSRELIKKARPDERLREANIKGIVQYINDHYLEHITMKDVSIEANMSREHISRLFRQQLGITFKGYLTSLRLDHACKMLRNTEEDLLTIALESGFPNAKALNSYFYKTYGMLPKQYRKTI